MNQEGAIKFAEITRNNIGRQLAITLDGTVQTAPMINSEIPSGNGVITGKLYSRRSESYCHTIKCWSITSES